MASMTPARGLAGEEIPEGEDRLLTAPNLITLVRLLCIPLFLWLLFGAEEYLVAAVLLLTLGATDWVDGYVARHFGQVSNFGKMFDPTVDRLLLIVGIAGIMVVDPDIAYFVPFAWVVLVREILLSAVVAGSIALGARRMDVSWVGKCGAFALMGTFPVFLAAADPSLEGTVARTVLIVLGWLSGIPGLACSLVAFVGYLREVPTALREGREMRSALGTD